MDTRMQLFSGHGAPKVALTTNSEKMLETLKQIEFASSSNQPVLLMGETGVGKGVIASAIHQGSKRTKGPFLRLSPHYGSHDLISSELFGHTRGAFTGATESRIGLVEEANRGTLFLDEVDLLPNATQVNLLHTLQEGEFSRIGSSDRRYSDFRLIAATNCLKERLLSPDTLRRDFYHRIAHLVIEIPPLRERKEDILDLARLGLVTGSHIGLTFSSDVEKWLVEHEWPGNVRELLAAVSSAASRAVFRSRKVIELEDFELFLRNANTVQLTLEDQIAEFEAKVVKSVWLRNNCNHSATARDLGIDRRRVRRALIWAGEK
ncbi:MAG: sigma-54-dependent Fis family transcriptional regulator [Bdellovibrionales bacterium]|nr:sigma-54-dependent Fis family transcriptional regulator [Bdellovibrionales bacterium]